jgi:hypothetical protein
MQTARVIILWTACASFAAFPFKITLEALALVENAHRAKMACGYIK